jgi:hypothetical protein
MERGGDQKKPKTWPCAVLHKVDTISIRRQKPSRTTYIYLLGGVGDGGDGQQVVDVVMFDRWRLIEDQ